MTGAVDTRAALDAAIVAQLDREVFVSRASLRVYGATDATTADCPPGRPVWWVWMTPHMREVAEAAEAAGLWVFPGDAT